MQSNYSDAAWLAISLDRDGALSLQVQLFAALRDRILAGLARPGAALPPSRAFAAELGVARSTVVCAYEQLEAEGYVEGRRGAGVFVCLAPEAALPPAAPTPALPPAPSTARVLRPTFRPGLPDMRLFPQVRWARAVAKSLREVGAGMMAPGDPLGAPALRHALALHLAEWRGLAVEPANLFVTAGAGGALDLTFDALTRPGDLVALENPGYAVVRAIAEQRGLTVAPISIDAGGFSVADLRGLPVPPKLVVVTPSNQFPLGMAAGAGRRAELLAWAARSGCVVVEDDYDSEFRFSGRPLPALASAPGEAQVVYVGTLSKVFSPGLRIGYLAAPAALAAPFRRAVARFGARASAFPQAPLAEFIASGDFARHLRRMRRIYAGRRAELVRVLEAVFGPGVLIPSQRDAGMHLVATLGGPLAGMSDVEAAERAAAVGIRIEALSRYYFAPPVREGLLLGFAGMDAQEMRGAAADLRGALLG